MGIKGKANRKTGGRAWWSKPQGVAGPCVARAPLVRSAAVCVVYCCSCSSGGLVKSVKTSSFVEVRFAAIHAHFCCAILSVFHGALILPCLMP